MRSFTGAGVCGCSLSCSMRLRRAAIVSVLIAVSIGGFVRFLSVNY